MFLPRDEETAVTSSTKEFSSTISTTGQKHFYMETQSTLVVPNKSADSIVVTCATQCLTSIHNELSKTLDLKASNITVGSSRVFYYFQSYVTHLATHTHTHTQVQAVSVGGAYGGKAYLPAPIAAATSVAALVTKRPVLCQLSRNDDMSSLGGRPACSADFTVKVNDSTGEITDMKVHTTVDAGFDKSGGVTLIFKYTNHNAYVCVLECWRIFSLLHVFVMSLKLQEYDSYRTRKSLENQCTLSIVTNTGTLSDSSILI